MASEEPGVELSGEYEQFGRWGSFGSDIGKAAIRMARALTVERPAMEPESAGRSIVWDRGDKFAFIALSELDSTIEIIEPAPDPIVSGNDIYRLFKEFHRLHAALPFSEAERYWVVDRHRHTRERDFPESLIGEAAEVMSGGLWSVIQGRELVRRWWAWGRQTDEFSGGDGLSEAVGALNNIGDTLVLDRNRPNDDPTLYTEPDY